MQNYENLFPFSKIRDEQRQAIEFALNAFSSGKRFVVLEAPTGVGKSAIGVTIARAMQTDAYILTTQKVLQDQYTSDFGPKKLNLIQSIKSATNYDCHGTWGQTCGETRRFRSVKKRSNKAYKDACEATCPYTECKKSFIASPIGVTNFAYFLAETMHAHQLKPRGLLILDECHNVETSLSSFVEVTFSLRFARQQLGCNGPQKRDIESVHKWIKGSYRKALTKKIADLEREIEVMSDSGKSEEDSSTLGRRLELLDSHLNKVNRFLDDYSLENWVMNAISPEQQRTSKSNDKTPTKSNVKAEWKFEFKPIDVSPYAEDALYRNGEKILLMSATIINHETFCETIGIKPGEAAFISLPSPFPAENRPVLYSPVGRMSQSGIEKSLPGLVKTIQTLLADHPNEKGMIHTGNYKIAKHLQEHVGSSRLLFHESSDREAVLQVHLESDEPTVLVSPSMTEGVDLRDDASRWQVIAKIPFPYLGDEMTKKRMARNGRWYGFVTARTIIQSLGRSVRNEKDYAISYILDEDWEAFFRRSGDMFNDDFRKAYHG